jgi:hypothetical protein
MGNHHYAILTRIVTITILTFPLVTVGQQVPMTPAMGNLGEANIRIDTSGISAALGIGAHIPMERVYSAGGWIVTFLAPVTNLPPLSPDSELVIGLADLDTNYLLLGYSSGLTRPTEGFLFGN